MRRLTVSLKKSVSSQNLSSFLYTCLVFSQYLLNTEPASKIQNGNFTSHSSLYDIKTNKKQNQKSMQNKHRAEVLQPGPPSSSRIQLGHGTTFLPGPKDASISHLITHVLEHGYVILPSLFPSSLVSRALDELTHLSSLPIEDSGPASHGGRNPFEGYKTNRIYALADKSRVFDDFAINETVLKLNDYFLQENYLLTSFHTVTIEAGEGAQSMHTDDGLIQLPRPRPLMGIVSPLFFLKGLRVETDVDGMV